MGLFVEGAEVEVPGGEVVNYRDDASIALTSRSCGPRRKRVAHVVLHTTGGYPDHNHPTPQTIRSETASPEHCHARRVIRGWAEGERVAGAHIVVDADGTVFQCADLATTATWHCVGLNQVSVGVEVVQQRDSSLFAVQLGVVVKLCEVLRERFGLPRTVALPYRGQRITLDGVGVLGHRDASSNRGAGDPGDFVMQALVDAGWQAVG